MWEILNYLSTLVYIHTHIYIYAHTFICMYRYTHIYEGYHGGHVEGRSKDNLLELVLYTVWFQGETQAAPDLAANTLRC